MTTQKNISFGTRRGKVVNERLHIELPGCVVNITTGLHNTLGQCVTAIAIQADQYAGEQAWRIPTWLGGEAKSLHIRVIQDSKDETRPVTTTPDVTDLAAAIRVFEQRFPKGYAHTTFASSDFRAGAIELGMHDTSHPDKYIYFDDIGQAIQKIQKFLEGVSSEG